MENKYILFENNQKLVSHVYSAFIKKQRQEVISLHGDDLYQEGMLGLWDACRRYDETRGTEFSTYAVPYIKGYMRSYLYKVLNLDRKTGLGPVIVSLDEVVATDADGNEITRGATIAAKEPDDVSWILDNKKLSDKEQKIVKLMYEGYTLQEIADKFGVSKQRMYELKRKIKNKLIAQGR